MIALSFRFPHHGKFASYHRLLDYLDARHQVVDATIPPALFNQRYLNWRDMAGRTWRWLKEAEAWSIANASNSPWMHYLYPEQGYFNGFNRKKRNQRIFFTCHLPESVLEPTKPKGQVDAFIEGLSHTDGIIVMSPGDIGYYERLAPQARVTFIPHGIDIHHFKPRPRASEATPKRFRVLTVGNMMRDFPRLAAVIRRAAEKRAEIEFNVVANAAPLENLRKLVGEDAWRTVRAHQGISDKALLELYSSCDLLFLPLWGATANNALLEALAMGIPIFVSDLPACRAYARDFASYFAADLDEDDLLQALTSFASDRARLAEMAGRSRTLAESEFSWEVIAKRHDDFMESL